MLKILTAGFTDIERAVLDAAKESGVETGGTAANGWATADGSRPMLMLFGLEEHANSSSHTVCSKANIDKAEASLFVYDVLEPRLIDALEHSDHSGKRHMNMTFDMWYKIPRWYDGSPHTVADWIVANGISTIAVVGSVGSKRFNTDSVKAVVKIVRSQFTEMFRLIPVLEKHYEEKRRAAEALKVTTVPAKKPRKRRSRELART